LHKHKWSWTVKYEPDHFGRDDFVPPGYPKVERWVNVGDLDDFGLTAGKDPIEVDLTSLGVQKLLGSGTVGRAYNVRVPSFTKRAQSKLQEAGGKILS
jgi:large subunit ribosomal protein L15